MTDFTQQIASELKLALHGVAAVVALLEEGNTIPFIARYRKEATGNLDEVQIRDIEDRLAYLKELQDRRETILASIESQGKLTPELKAQIISCEVKSALEDLYLPYKPKRRTRAMIAREKGLEPLAELIMAQGSDSVSGSDEDLSGARDIVAEVVAENAEIRGMIRKAFMRDGVVVSKVVKGKDKERSKFEQYYDFKEPVQSIPSHRYLAIRRGEKEEILDFGVEVDAPGLIEQIQTMMQHNPRSPWGQQLELAIEDSFKRLIAPSVETDVRVELKMRSDGDAVDIFADNLRHLLMAAPLGEKPVFGIDPGLRTGCKLAVVDSTGKFLENATLYLTQGGSALQRAQAELLAMIERFKPFAIAVGNGTGNREAESFVRDTLGLVGIKDIVVVQVNEAGASVYSASDVARDEFPDLDLTVRGAISIARRLQDPLAELVKIDPKSIGVGQYQHDVYQPMLQDKLEHVVESCVNAVGVELNTASASLLSYVAGIGGSQAKKIVGYRDEKGAFQSRKEVLKVPGLGAKTFEQAAGFLRLRNGHPLDASAVHPEQYKLVEQIAGDLGMPLGDVIGNGKVVDSIDTKKYENAGSYTLRDIIDELKKPGRDPRASFEPPKFREDVQEIKDLNVGMMLEGVVTNVTAFGAFVDIGVHQDGLVHVSELADKFVKDPSEVVSAGDKIKVRVLEVDAARKRISLSARKESSGQSAPKTQAPQKRQGESRVQRGQKKPEGFFTSPFADL